MCDIGWCDSRLVMTATCIEKDKEENEERIITVPSVQRSQQAGNAHAYQNRKDSATWLGGKDYSHRIQTTTCKTGATPRDKANRARIDSLLADNARALSHITTMQPSLHPAPADPAYPNLLYVIKANH